MRKVLIAEDDVVSRRILVSCVRKMGDFPIEASNGKRAWGVLSDNQDIDLLITDMMMPDMSGEELITIVRGTERLLSLPIILVSGVVGPKEIAHLLKLGASRFIPKPIKVSDLEQAIEALFA